MGSTLKKVTFMANSTRTAGSGRYYGATSGGSTSTRRSGSSTSTRNSGPTTGSVGSTGSHREPSGYSANSKQKLDMYDPGNILTNILSRKGLYPDNEDGEKQQGIDLLNALKTIDQRQYDRFLTLDDRQYNSIQSQMARLLSLGMSRDQAIAMLSNSATQIQNSAQPFGSDASIMPSETALNEQQVKESKFNMAMQGIQTAISLASFGMSVPSFLASNVISGANAFLNRKTVDAFNATSTLGQFVGDATRAGLINEDSWKNTESLISTLSPHYQGDPNFQSAINEFYSNPIARDNINSLVNSRWSTNKVRPDSTLLDWQRQKVLAELELSQSQVTYTAEQTQEIRERCKQLYGDGGLIQQEAQNYQQNNLLIGEQIQTAQVERSNARKRGVLLDQQSNLAEAQATYIDTRRQEQEYVNTIQSATALAYELNFDDVTQANVDRLKFYAAEMEFCNSQEMREATFGRMLADENAARTLASLNIYRNKVDLDLAERFDGWFSVARAFDVFNCKDMIGTIENALTQHDARFTLLTKDINNMLPMLKGSYGINSSVIGTTPSSLPYF